MRRVPILLMGFLLVGVGTAVAVWRRIRPPHREQPLDPGQRREQPQPIPATARSGSARLQLPNEGHGPLFHRCYRADIAQPQRSATALMAEIKRDLPHFSPDALAQFAKAEEHPEMRVGDEYDIKILGPWNGSVRVIEVEPTSFALATLEGHPEAGQIRFQLMPHPDIAGALRFEIHSWARSRDALVHLTYRHLKAGQTAQKNTWTVFCERVVDASGGALLGEIVVSTAEQPFDEEELTQ